MVKKLEQQRNICFLQTMAKKLKDLAEKDELIEIN